ncbi:MAG: thiamine pyrophosphate-dependent enzyme [Bacillota bacterium]|nr:thiamine pyrophosphate-dependent enzyme [Bacillota bacterium]
MKPVYEKYFRNNLPHIWCSGCGNGIVMSAWARAMEEVAIDKDNTIAVSGIGCSSRITGYLDLNTLHTAHGRALPFATGCKMAKPDMDVFIFSGDGDCSAIGGNHFIHACRRNMDMTMIVINNNIYGMTGGQFSPLTPFGKKGTTAPYGSVDRCFDLCELAMGAGATFVARGDIFHAKQLTDLIVAGYKHKGFSVIEVLASCPISFGRRNKIPKPADMMQYVKDHTVALARAEKMSPEELKGMYITGILRNESDVEYNEEYLRLCARVQGGE